MSEENFRNYIDEILMDCNGEEDEYMSWYYYVEDELEFPFRAKIVVRKDTGEKFLKEIEVLELSSDENNFHRNFDLKVDIKFDDYIIEVPLSKLKEIKSSEKITEIIDAWNYWIKK